MAPFLHPSLFATYAGLGWAAGQFGKRYGAEEPSSEAKLIKDKEVALNDNTQLMMDSCVTVIYLLGACSVALLASMGDMSSASRVFAHGLWLDRIPVTMFLGVVEGVGTVASVAVIGYAGRHSLTAVAPVIMNSLYAICAPIAVAAVFGSALSLWFWLAMLCLVLGIVLASGLASNSAPGTNAQMGPGVWISVGSFFVAICWSCGTLGMRYIMADVPAELEGPWSSVSYASQVMPMLLSPILGMAGSAFSGKVIDREKVLAVVWRRCKVCFLCGMMAGSGGLSLQYALSHSGSEGATLVGLSQGTYNISCVIMFKAIYRESFNASQILGTAIMLAGVVVLAVTK